MFNAKEIEALFRQLIDRRLSANAQYLLMALFEVHPFEDPDSQKEIEALFSQVTQMFDAATGSDSSGDQITDFIVQYMVFLQASVDDGLLSESWARRRLEDAIERAQIETASAS